MKNLSNYRISALCEMRHDLERAFLSLYKDVNDLREIDRLASTFMALDETIEEEISNQEQDYESMVATRIEIERIATEVLTAESIMNSDKPKTESKTE